MLRRTSTAFLRRSLPLLAADHGGTGMYGLGPKKIMKEAGRKNLGEIIKLDEWQKASQSKVVSLWNDHHIQYTQYYGRVLETAAYEAVRPRLATCPYFVIPVFRDKGLFNVVTNFNSDLIGVAPLAEWQQKQDSAEIHMTIQGSGFLYNSVRIIAGTLVEVGRGRFEPSQIDAILKTADRRIAGPTLPPQGLCLEWVRYG